MMPAPALKIDGGIPNRLERAAGAAAALELDGYDGGWTAETSHDPFLPLWELDRTSRGMRNTHVGIDLGRQREIERAVSEYIREHFSFVVVRVDEKLERLKLESGMISTVSLCDACLPSAQWLSYSSPKEKIRENGFGS